MGRGKRTGRVPLSAEGGRRRLPPTLLESLSREAKQAAKPDRAAVKKAADEAALIAALQTLMAQSERQRLGIDFAYPPKTTRVMTDLLDIPEGLSRSRHRSQLTQLRRLGLINYKNGAWWPMPQAQAWLDEHAAQP